MIVLDCRIVWKNGCILNCIESKAWKKYIESISKKIAAVVLAMNTSGQVVLECICMWMCISYLYMSIFMYMHAKFICHKLCMLSRSESLIFANGPPWHNYILRHLHCLTFFSRTIMSHGVNLICILFYKIVIECWYIFGWQHNNQMWGYLALFRLPLFFFILNTKTLVICWT